LVYAACSIGGVWAVNRLRPVRAGDKVKDAAKGFYESLFRPVPAGGSLTDGLATGLETDIKGHVMANVIGGIVLGCVVAGIVDSAVS
jgi:hypothetical protein